ncbi:Choline-transporter-like protein [Blattamonas nauphoetae]|uniref:Choline transporter-like protein n=1 Tax=Blattamonas nauphoetae TaxID=2049346 RepID=A0ABQ9XAV8_9EUKA|nr:Choline-transporter-like protein [Blattamonas nauphoetae]
MIQARDTYAPYLTQPLDQTIQDQQHFLPYRKKNTTNIYSCIPIIILFLCLMAMGIWFAVSADIRPLYYPVPADGGFCGLETLEYNRVDQPYLFIPNPIDSTGNGWCVNQCPSPENSCICKNRGPFKNNTEAECRNTSSLTCYYTHEEEFKTISRRCVSESFNPKEDTGFDKLMFFQHLLNSLWVYGLAAVLSFVLSLLYLCCLRKHAKPLTYLSSILCILSLIALDVVLIYFAVQVRISLTAPIKVLVVFLIIFCICFTLYMLYQLFSSHRSLNYTLTIYDYVTSAWKDVPKMVCLPITTVLGTIIVLGLFFGVTFAIVASIKVDTVDGHRKYRFGPITILAMIVETVISILFVISVLGFSQISLSSIFSRWYFSGLKANGKLTRSRHSLSFAFRKIGSACNGALELLFGFPFHFLQKLYFSLKQKKNCLFSLLACPIYPLMCCCRNFAWYLTPRAFTMVGIKGKEFYPSAKDMGLLNLRNVFRTSVFSDSLSFVRTAGTIVIILIVTVISFILSGLGAPIRFRLDLASFFILATVPIFVFLISTVILQLYSIGAETIITCFLLDEEISRECQSEPYAPEEMETFMASVYEHGRNKYMKYHTPEVLSIGNSHSPLEYHRRKLSNPSNVVPVQASPPYGSPPPSYPYTPDPYAPPHLPPQIAQENDGQNQQSMYRPETTGFSTNTTMYQALVSHDTLATAPPPEDDDDNKIVPI